MQKTAAVLVKRYVVCVSLISLVLLPLSGCALFDSPPVASFVMSTNTGIAPLTVVFDASGSSDPDGDVASYQWDFGDGSSGVGVTTQHTFSEARTYRITLTVTDSQGKTAFATRELKVTIGGSSPLPPPPPRAQWVAGKRVI